MPFPLAGSYVTQRQPDRHAPRRPGSVESELPRPLRLLCCVITAEPPTSDGGRPKATNGTVEPLICPCGWGRNTSAPNMELTLVARPIHPVPGGFGDAAPSDTQWNSLERSIDPEGCAEEQPLLAPNGIECGVVHLPLGKRGEEGGRPAPPWNCLEQPLLPVDWPICPGGHGGGPREQLAPGCPAQLPAGRESPPWDGAGPGSHPAPTSRPGASPAGGRAQPPAALGRSRPLATHSQGWALVASQDHPQGGRMLWPRWMPSQEQWSAPAEREHAQAQHDGPPGRRPSALTGWPSQRPA